VVSVRTLTFRVQLPKDGNPSIFFSGIVVPLQELCDIRQLACYSNAGSEQEDSIV
jgi:hypothetical protein